MSASRPEVGRRPRIPSGSSTWLLTCMTLIAAALRVYCLDCQSLWLDEAASAYWTAIPLGEFFLEAADNLHVPGYYLLLRIWTVLSGPSAFSLRYFSVLGGLLLIPVAYSLTWHMAHNRYAAIFAAAFATLSPAHIYYSQETRMYAIMPALYLGMLGLSIGIRQRSHPHNWWWLALVEALALYLHLFSALMLLVINLLLAVVWWRGRSRRFLRYWLGSQAVTALVITPWLWFTWRSGGAIPANLVDSSGGAAIFSAGGYLRQVWQFLMTGMTNLRPELSYWSSVSVLLLAALSIPVLLNRRSPWRRALRILLAAIILPLLAGALVWTFNPLTHPRYLFFLVGPLSVLFGSTLGFSISRRNLLPLVAISAAMLLSLDIASLRAMHTDSIQFRYDAASLSKTIRQRGGPEDVVLMPPFDRSLWYYDPSPVKALNWPFAQGKPHERPEGLQRIVQDATGAFLVKYQDLYAYDLQGQIPFLLEANGHLTEEFTVDRMDVSHYALSGWQTPNLAPRSESCGPIRITGSYIPESVVPGDAPAIALQWELVEEVSEKLVASARLVDGDQTVSSADHPLLTAAGAGTGGLPVGTLATSYFILPLPLGSIPQIYDVHLLLYEEDTGPYTCGGDGSGTVRLGQIELARADRRTMDAYGTWANTKWHAPPEQTIAPGLVLEGYSIRPDALRPAEPANISLRWRAIRSMTQQYMPDLQFATSNGILSQSKGKLFRRYPTTRWQAGDMFIETRELTMPVTTAPVQLRIFIDDVAIPLVSRSVDASVLTWDTPPSAQPLCAAFEEVGTLRGAEWHRSEGNDRQFTLTLYWEGASKAPATQSYTVFAQLLASDGWVLAQDDGLPAEGRRPTTSWLPYEVIADAHEFTLAPDDNADLRLSVGLYDLATLERVPAYSCEGTRLANDALTIPVTDLN